MKKFELAIGLTILILSGLVPYSTTRADEGVAVDEEIKYPVETAVFELTLRDEQGEPIEGVTAKIYAMRCQEDRGSHYGWPTENIGPSPTVTSDANGFAKLTYPLKFGTPPDWLTTCEISISLRHPSFVGTELDSDPTTGTAEHSLVAGCEITLTAVDQDRDPILKFGVLMAGGGGKATWNLSENGQLRSTGVPPGSWQTMLVAPGDQGKTLYSGLIPTRLRGGQKIQFDRVAMSPGVRVVGRMPDEVQAPVRDGIVIAWCLPKPAGDTYADADPSLGFTEHAEIQEDGTFEFPSLPKTGKIQFIAICEGWVSVNDTPGNNFIKGTTVDLDSIELGADENLTLILPMEQTGSVKVTVKDPNGNPLAGTRVATWPNQYFEMAGSYILGTSPRTMDVVESQIEGTEPNFNRNDWRTPYRYYQVTDENGVAVLRDIPLNSSQGITVLHDDYLQPKNELDGDRDIRYQCKNTEPLEILVVMEPGVKE